MSLSQLKEQIKVSPVYTPLKALQKCLRGGPSSARDYLGEMQALRRAFCHPERLPRPAAQEETVLFSLLVPLYNTPEPFLREMIASVQGQFYSRWQLCLADGSDKEHGRVEEICREYAARDPRILYRRLPQNLGISGNTNECLKMAAGAYIALFDHDDLLHPRALYEAARAIREQGADFVYTDEATFLSPDRARITLLHYKPDFSPDNLLANNYICHFTVFAAGLLRGMEAFRSAYDGSQDHDLILRLTAQARKIAHIPQILYLWRAHPQSTASGVGVKSHAMDASQRAIRDFLFPQAVEISTVREGLNIYRISWPLMADVRDVTVISAAEAGAINRAVRECGTDYVLLLSPQAEPLEDESIRAMLMYAQRPDVGAVGAKLHHQGRITHAGVAVGIDGKRPVDYPYRGKPADEVGYMGRLSYAQDVTAVSGQCLMLRRALLEELGGLDEGSAGLWDIDLCLRLREAGYLNVFTPFACTCCPAAPPPGQADLDRFTARWQRRIAAGDPYYCLRNAYY